MSSRLAIGTAVNATLDVGSNNVTLASGIGGGGSVSKAGLGTLILTGNNTYTGTTTINAGTLQVGLGGTAGNLGTGGVNGSATLAFNRSDNVTVGNVLSGGISLLQQGSGTLTLTGSNTYTGGTTINAGSTLQVDSSASVLGTGIVTVNGTLDLNGYTPVLGGLSGNGRVIPMSVRDGGTLLMDGASLNFGTTLTGAPVERALTIENDSAGTLTIDPNSLVLPNGFSLATALPTSLAPNQSALLLVQLDATTAGTYSGSLSFATNQLSENPFHFTVSGTVNAPAPRIAVGTVDPKSGVIAGIWGTVTFVNTPAGTPVEQTFQVQNTGTGTLTLDASSLVLPAGFSLASDYPFPTSLSPGAWADFAVQLDAVAAGTDGGTMSFGTNDANNDPVNVTLSGTVNPLAPQTSVYVSINKFFTNVTPQTGTVSFGNTLTGSSTGLTFEIKNTGNAVLTIDPTTLSLPSGFSLASAMPQSVSPGQTATFELQMDADSAGSYSGSVSFATNDSAHDPFTFLVTGTVTDPVASIALSLAASSGSTYTAVAYQTGSVDFGTTVTGSTVTETFQVEDTGTAALTIDSTTLVLPAGYSLVGTLPSSINPGQTGSFQLQLDATAAGSYPGTVSFATNDAAHNPFSFSVLGQVNAPAPAISVLLNAGVLANGTGDVVFPTTVTGKPTTETLTIENVGTATLTLDQSTLVVPAGFSVSTPYAGSVASGGSTTIG
ncbi:MAG: beta strand repeat-containing protein, partial [Candidatus Saccharimonadales bacterium]